MQKIWNITKPDLERRAGLSRALGVSQVFAQLLINRGLATKAAAEGFLDKGVSCLHDPYLFSGMDKAVARIRQAVSRREKVLVFGDYDVDGVTSAALMKSTLEKLGLEVLRYLPQRVQQGYGINEPGIAYAREKGARLFISVDCGITNFSEIDALNGFDIDSIIVDHHEPLDVLPAATAIINPKLKNDPYPFKDLAAVGVVYKLCQALCDDALWEDLDLVALGTIADVVPLTGENRIIVSQGLPRMQESKKPGLRGLIERCGLKGKGIDTYAVGFILGPRLNAAGRIGSAAMSFDLLTSGCSEQAQRLAEELHCQNKRRQAIEADILGQALSQVEREINFREDNVIVLDGDGWHPGVLGIVASRIVERFYRPAIIIGTGTSSSGDGDSCLGKGSARSIRDFHIFRALDECRRLLKSYGGHSYAAGITIAKRDIPEFRAAINDIARRDLRPESLVPALDIDIEVKLEDVDHRLIGDIDKLKPFGAGNPAPLFASRNLFVRGRPQVLGKRTLKFWVSDGVKTYSAVGFGLAERRETLSVCPRIDLAYRPSLDRWQGRNEVQLEAKDIRPSNSY